MGGFSNSLRERLRSAPSTGAHPEPEVLSAFLEQALGATERKNVLEHLAACGACREIVALSLPEQAETAATHSLPVSRSNWAVLGRWVALAAVLVIGVTISLERPWQISSQQHQTDNLSQTVVAPPPPPPPAARDQASSSEPRSQATPAVSAVPRVAPARAQAEMQVAGNAVARKTDQDSFAAKAKNGVLPVERPDYINEAFLTSHQAVYVDGRTLVNAPRQVATAAGQPVAIPGAMAASSVLQANPTVPNLSMSESANKVVLLTPQPLQMPKSEEHSFYGARALTTFIRRFPALTLNSTGNALSVSGAALAPIVRGTEFAVSGGLSRSNEATGLEHLNAFTNEARGDILGVEALPHNWKIAHGELLKSVGSNLWEAVNPPGEASHFSVVEARGNDIWTGTVHSTVMHSRDGGATWSELRLGDHASGEVTAIEIDGKNVRVTTSDHQLWITNDAGHSWKMQNPGDLLPLR